MGDFGGNFFLNRYTYNMSSNVSEFEALYRHTLVEPTYSNFHALESIEDARRPRIFVGKNIDFIRKTQDNLLEHISELIGYQKPRLTTNDNNRFESDLREMVADVEIEIKLGAMTDANLGLSAIEWALDLDEGELKEVLIENGGLPRRQIYQSAIWEGRDPWPLIKEHKSNMFNACVEIFKKGIGNSGWASERLAHLCYAISRGITEVGAIKESMGKLDGVPVRHLFQLKPSGAFVASSKVIPLNDPVRVVSVGMGTRGGGAQIHLGTSERSIKILAHYKNSFTSQGIKIPARAGVSTPCANIWIR
jgi:hypothetical protein